MTASFKSPRTANEQEHRTADMRLIVMDIDSTLINEEVIDLLGEEAGVGEQVAADHRARDARRNRFQASARRARGAACRPRARTCSIVPLSA